MEKTHKKYLEAIFLLKRKGEHVRAAYIAKQLGVSRASVCRALKKLEELEYIQVGINKDIDLTPLGLESAQSVYGKQVLVEQFLSQVINVSDEIAYRDANKIKHYISDEVYIGIQKFLEDW